MAWLKIRLFPTFFDKTSTNFITRHHSRNNLDVSKEQTKVECSEVDDYHTEESSYAETKILPFSSQLICNILFEKLHNLME